VCCETITTKEIQMIQKTLIALALATVCGVASAQSFFDDFNRADAGTLGSNWTNQAGSLGIATNRAISSGGGVNQATVNGISNALGTYTISVDADTGGAAGGYVAIVMGYAGTGMDQSIFFKLQAQTGSGLFSNYAFYTGNNISSGTAYSSGGGFFGMAEAYRTARMTMSVSGLDVTVEVDGNINGSIDNTFTATMNAGFAAGLGTGAGLGIWAAASADNYTVVPEPGSLVAIAMGIASLAFLRRRR
jgi:hypothetical protein